MSGLTKEQATREHFRKLMAALDVCIGNGDYEGATEISRRISAVADSLPEGTFTPEEIADRLNVKPATVKQWCRDGVIECIELRGKGKENKTTDRENKKYVITVKAFKQFCDVNTKLPLLFAAEKANIGRRRASGIRDTTKKR